MRKNKGETKDATKGAENKADDNKTADDELREAELAALREENAELRAYKEQRQKEDQERAEAQANRGVQIQTGQQYAGPRLIPGRRLYLTADEKRLVPQNHPDARSLYCTEHQSVPRDEYNRLNAHADAD